MLRIDEKIDLSKRVLDIDVESPIFNCLMIDLNKEIQRCIRKVFDEEFESGEISIKLTIEIPNDYETFPKLDELTGETIDETFKYRKPNFEHKISTTLKKQYKAEGGFTDKREVRFEDGKFIAIPIKQAQMDMFD